MNLKRSVLVVENEPLLRDLIASMLKVNGFEVNTAENAALAKRAVELHDPDALVLDIDLGLGPNGFHLAKAIGGTKSGRAIVFLTNLPDARFAGDSDQQVMKGAAYLRKSSLSDASVLVGALNAVLSEAVGLEYRHDLSQSRPLVKLSSSQLQVLRFIAQGKSNSQIATLRGTSVRAVEAIVTRIFGQLQISNTGDGNPRVEAANAYFSAMGLKP